MEPNFQRLGNVAKARRIALGLTQRSAAIAAGIATQTWLNLEKGESVKERTLGGVDRALRWEPGSAADVLADGVATELPTDDDDTELRAEVAELRRRLDDAVARIEKLERLGVKPQRSPERVAGTAEAATAGQAQRNEAS